MVSGIGAIGIVIAQFASLGASLGKRVMEGRVKLNEKDHIVAAVQDKEETQEHLDATLMAATETHEYEAPIIEIRRGISKSRAACRSTTWPPPA